MGKSLFNVGVNIKSILFYFFNLFYKILIKLYGDDIMSKAKSAYEISNIPIRFCQEDRYFKETSNKELTELSENIEALREELQDKQDELMELAQDIDDKRDLAKDLITQADLITKKKEVTDEDIDTVMKNKEKARALNKEAKEAEKELKGKRKEVKAEVDALQDKLIDEYDKICLLIFENYESGEFKEKSDNRDMAKINNIQMLYDLHFEQFKPEKIRQRVKQTINMGHDQMFQDLPDGDSL
jgi:chromosome segregation ATPase